MGHSRKYYIGEGVLRGFILSLILMLIYSVVITFFSISQNTTGIYIIIVTLLSVLYGSIYATRKIRSRGWITGLCVALLYMIILYIVSMIAGQRFTLQSYHLYRLLLALAVGTLSGMLGINL